MSDLNNNEQTYEGGERKKSINKLLKNGYITSGINKISYVYKNKNGKKETIYADIMGNNNGFRFNEQLHEEPSALLRNMKYYLMTSGKTNHKTKI